jgi:hypothetical protein
VSPFKEWRFGYYGARSVALESPEINEKDEFPEQFLTFNALSTYRKALTERQ